MTALALDKNVLVLNRFFQAVQITSVRRAFVLFCKGYVRALDDQYTTYTFNDWKQLPPGDDSVSTPTYKLRLPRVVQLIYYDKVPRFKIRFSRKNIFLRDRFVCQYCGEKVPEKKLTLDHVKPVSRGGKNTWSNLVTSCFECNNRKGDNSPEQAGMPLLRKPRKPNWIPYTRFASHHEPHPLWKSFIDLTYYGMPSDED